MLMESEGTKTKRDRASRAPLVTTLTILFALAIWFVVLAPVFESAKMSALEGREVGYVRAADIALIQYAADHGDRYPDLSRNIPATLAPYIHDSNVLQAMGRFTWNDKLSGLRLEDIDNHTDLWVIHSSAPTSTMIAYANVDGLARDVNPTYFESHFAEVKPILRHSHDKR